MSITIKCPKWECDYTQQVCRCIPADAPASVTHARMGTFHNVSGVYVHVSAINRMITSPSAGSFYGFTGMVKTTPGEAYPTLIELPASDVFHPDCLLFSEKRVPYKYTISECDIHEMVLVKTAFNKYMDDLYNDTDGFTRSPSAAGMKIIGKLAHKREVIEHCSEAKEIKKRRDVSLELDRRSVMHGESASSDSARVFIGALSI